MPDSATSILPEGRQGPLQWAVRLLGVLAFAALLGSVPALHVYWHYVRGETLPMIRTNTQTPKPPWDLEEFRSGALMHAWEDHLRENTPVTWDLRGRYNELRYHLGLLQTNQVRVASDGWMFLRHTLDADPELLAGAAEGRRQALASLRRRVDALGVELFAVPVPDKVTVYPEAAFTDGRLPADKARLYPLILEELEAAGIPHFDVRPALMAAKAEPDAPLLYYRADSHWSGTGALTVGRATALALREAGLEPLMGPAVAFEVIGPIAVRVPPDLVSLLGFRYAQQFEPRLGEDLPRPVSATARALEEDKEYFQLWLKDPAGPELPNIPYESRLATTPVALAGTSFSAERGRWTFAYALGRVLDHRGVISAGGPFVGLQETLARIESGESAARLIVWEFVERSYIEEIWLDPPLF